MRTVEGRESHRDQLVRDSWLRCVFDHNLDPTVRRPAVIVDNSCLHEHREAAENLLHTARFGVEALYRQVAGLGYVLLLTDHEGITVDYMGDEATTDQLRDAGLYLGADWSERHAGTNGTGTCLEIGEALTVHRTDHFDTQHIPLTCTVAPIFDSTGQIAAALDISALTSPLEKTSQYLALQIVKSYAHKIETAHLIQSCSRNWIIKLTSNQGLASVDTEYVLALDTSGRIVGFNHFVRQLLAQESRVGWRTEGLLLGRLFSDFFDLDIDQLTRFASPHRIERNMVRLRASGRQLFIQVIPPTTFRVLAPPQPGNDQLPEELRNVTGDDPRIAASLAKVARLVNTNMSILVQGETGTGKEYLAKAIHAASARSSGPFVPVNCAALPETLIESELFGYEAGSFTGALSKGKKGLVREAHGGTLFLDEIGDMPEASQTRLLRVLAEREVMPVGGSRAHSIDIRVIAATHCDLKERIKQGLFREDLYFRLNGAVVTLPPLRERQDFEWLVNKLLTKQNGSKPAPINPEAMAALKAYRWPGNIRELGNAMEYARAIAQGEDITIDHLPEYVFAAAEEDLPSTSEPDSDAAQTLRNTLRLCQWNVSAAARMIGVDRTTLHRRMRRLGVKLPPRST